MNPCIVNLLGNAEKVRLLTEGLPIAFGIAQKEIPGNPAIGILREQIIIGYFISEFGHQQVEIPDTGTEEGFDATVCGEKLSIKTITGNQASSIKLRWTSDNLKVQETITKYQPQYDFFLVTIHWNKTSESIFYVPLSVQSEVYGKLGINRYVRTTSGTDNRGFTLTKDSLTMLQEHPETLRQEITWTEQDIDHNPYQRWESFWINRRSS